MSDSSVSKERHDLQNIEAKTAARLSELRLKAAVGDAVRRVKPWQHPAPKPVDDGLTWIYFVQAGDDGPIKIGAAQNVVRRVRTLQTSSPAGLHLLGMVRASALHEGELHDLFSPARLHGEWFEPTPELLAYIAKVAE